LLSGVALRIVLSGLRLMAGDSTRPFEEDTGVPWAEVAGTYPTVKRQFSII
jgi:hypothetical protein